MKIAPLVRLGIPRSRITRTGDTADGYRVMSAGRLAHAYSPLSLLELALVTIVLGIAVAVSVPEFLDLRQDASDDAAKSRLTQATSRGRRHVCGRGDPGRCPPPGGRSRLVLRRGERR